MSSSSADPDRNVPPPPRSRVRAAIAPRMWGAHALMVICVAAAVALGMWQYSNSQRAKDAQIDDLVHADPRPVTELIGPDDAFPGMDLGRPAVVTGRWLPESTVLVGGQQNDGRDGYWVATPVEVADTGSAMYIVRGWTDSEDDVPPAPSGRTRLVGWLQPPQQDGLPDDDPDDEVLPEMDLTGVLDRVDGDIYGAYAVSATGDEDLTGQVDPVNDGSEGLAPVSAPQPPEADASTGLRNLLYAIEWWLFGLLALYIWWRYVRDATRPAPPLAPLAEGQDEPAADDATDRAVPSGS